jgi:hypothetical protein
VVALIAVDVLVLGLLAVALPTAVRIHLRWSFPAATRGQLELERKAWLAAAVIAFALAAKLPALALFLHTVDGLADRIAGAMCGVGVLASGRDAAIVIGLRVLVVYLLVAWRAAHRLDLARPDAPHTRVKFTFFLVLFASLALELVFELAFFASVRTDRVASCCGTVFAQTGVSATALFGQTPQAALAAASTGLFAAAAVAARLRRPVVFGVLNGVFALVGVALVIGLTSPYVFALPTHRCPFCLLHPEYAYVGYALFGTLLAGTASGVTTGFAHAALREDLPWYRRTLVLNGLFLAGALAFPMVYWVRNGVWL